MSNLKPHLLELFQQYADDHRHPMNRLTHKIAIPLIVFHIIVMLDWIKLIPIAGGHLSVAHIFLVLTNLYYFSLHAKLAILMTILTLPMLWAGTFFSTGTVVAIAVVGWIVQLSGHYIWEKNSPSFQTNMLQALIGPLFFIATLTGEFPPSKNTDSPS